MTFNLFGPPTKNDIRIGYIHPIEGYVSNVTIDQANLYEKDNPKTVFIFRDGNNTIRYLSIDEVNQLSINDLFSTNTCGGINQKKECGPPTVQFFGGGGIGAAGNLIIGRDGSILGVDIVNGGNGYKSPPIVKVIDDCNLGSGAVLTSVLGRPGVVTEVIVSDPGNGYLKPISQNQGYPVSLKLKKVIVENPGINYNPGVDELRITPNNGTKLDYKSNPFGKIGEVKVLDPGFGFTEYPEIRLISETGVNASFRPVFEVVRDPIVTPERLLQVTDLVGLKQTGYINGRAYFGSVYYDQGVKFTGLYETIGDPIRVYDTLQESITSEVTTRPSAILKQGTDITNNNPRLNIPKTPQNLI
jgi:hypothetical protein